MINDVELKPIDADHFWYGDVMVDIPLLVHQAKNISAQTHKIGGAIGTLVGVADNLILSKQVGWEVEPYPLWPRLVRATWALKLSMN